MSQKFLFPETHFRERLGDHWFSTRDGDIIAKLLFDRHYSRIKYADGRQPKLFVGPGAKTVMLTENGDALWVWRKFISGDGQQGVNCAIFRNEGPVLSSELILDAEKIAWKRWPGQRLFTYVNPRKIKSSNPGACFKIAGWNICGETKRHKLLILEKAA
jgi:hypothetical protein